MKLTFLNFMLEKWTNPHLIFILTLVSIIIAIVGENTTELFLVNVLFYILIVLLTLKEFRQNPNTSSRKNLKILLLLIVISIICDVFANHNWIPDLRSFFLYSAGLIRIGFFAYGWLSMVRALAHRQKVTNRTIIFAITAYLFIGIIWSFIYSAIWQINPDAFHITLQREYELNNWNLAMYFSLITLTTVGYGDMIPVDKWAMVSANFEAMSGAIYLAVIIARLVSLYSTSDEIS